MACTPRAVLEHVRPLVLAAAAVALLAGGCGSDDEQGSASGGGSTQAAAETQKVTLLLPAPLGLNWSAFLVAKDRYWPEMGLEVEGVGTDGSSAVVQQLVSGNAQYGIASAAAIYQAATEGAKVKSIAGLTHDDVARLSVPESDTSVQGVEDLKGKSIGITSAGDGSIPIVEAVMRQAGMQKDDYKLPIVGEGGPAVVQAFKSGRIQAYAHGVSDVAGIEVTGKTPLRSIMPEEFNGLPGNSLTVMQETIDDPAKLDVAIKLARGWIQGANFVLENPAEAKKIGCKVVPEACTDDAIATRFVELSGETSKQLDPENPGRIDPKKAETLITAVAGKPKIPIDQVLLDDHVAKIAEGL
jgi:NitT/TauT family transport system substrate-binding protein